MSKENQVKLQLIMDVTLRLDGASVEELKTRLAAVGHAAINRGAIIGDTPAVVLSHEIDVDEILSSSDDEEPADSAAHLSRGDKLRLLQQQFKTYVREHGAECCWMLATIARDTGIPEAELFDNDTHEGLLTDLSNRGLLIHSSCPGALSGYGHSWAMDCTAFLE